MRTTPLCKIICLKDPQTRPPKIVGEKEIKQENIAFERQDIDSQSGNIKNLAQADSERVSAKEMANYDDEKQNGHNE